jgi:hypothetical protein
MMRIMLGTSNKPYLLVDVNSKYDPLEFHFDVINGDWLGYFKNNRIYCENTKEWLPEAADIICIDQDRLRGHYKDVFDNFSNPKYIAPKIESTVTSVFYDDIPF